MMSDLEKAYIGLELETHVWNVDIENNGMNTILDNGIAGSPEDIYRFIYDNGYNCSENKLQFLLDENDSSGNMFYPIDCQLQLSYDGWLKYRGERKIEELKKYNSSNIKSI